MAVSQTVSNDAAGRVIERGVSGTRNRWDARMAGIGLLVAISSVVLLYGGSSIVAGTRPDHATEPGAVIAFYGHPELAILFWQATVSVIAVVFFALAFRRYAKPFATHPVDRQLLDFGIALVLLEAPILIVEFGLQLSLVRLAGLADGSLLGVFMAWNWIDNGTMLTLEIGWVAVLSVVAWRTGTLSPWLAAFGLVVSGLMVVAVLPSLPFDYPDGMTMFGYVPFIAWFVATGIYLVRGGSSPEPAAERPGIDEPAPAG